MSQANELVQCRLCGNCYRSLGHHLRWKHDLAADDYRDRFNMRRGAPLTAPSARARWSATMLATHASGALDAHIAGNADRARLAGAIGADTIRRRRAAGVLPPADPRTTPREVIEAIVAAIETGTGVAAAVKRSPISYTGYHLGLARHPDLKERLEQGRGRAATHAGVPDAARSAKHLRTA